MKTTREQGYPSVAILNSFGFGSSWLCLFLDSHFDIFQAHHGSSKSIPFQHFCGVLWEMLNQGSCKLSHNSFNSQETIFGILMECLEQALHFLDILVDLSLGISQFSLINVLQPLRVNKVRVFIGNLACCEKVWAASFLEDKSNEMFHSFVIGNLCCCQGHSLLVTGGGFLGFWCHKMEDGIRLILGISAEDVWMLHSQIHAATFIVMFVI